ncbi:HalOD1 output domain-containing protein [Natronococcus sp.]|uniref:HalOD1 output domain-containing protein n=1 Tax=Natronococcus sp. TaxID=35747 RepID=UPI003A4E0B28
MQTESTSRDESDELRDEQGDDRYVFHYDDDDTATLTATIVHALASIADTDVSQGEFSLYDSIDPDALDRIFRPKADGTERTGGHIAFTALEHEVYVYADGEIVIYPPAETRRPGPHR